MDVRKRLWDIAKIAVTLAALTYLFMQMDISAFIENVMKINILVIALSGFFVLLIMAMKVLRWRMLIGKGDFIFLLKSYFVAMFFGAFTPSKIGDFVRGFHLRKKYDLTLTRSMTTVIYDRLLDMLCVFVYGVISVMFLFFTEGGGISLVLLLVAGMFGLAVSYFKLGYILKKLLPIFGKVSKSERFKFSTEGVASEIEKISHKRKDVFVFSFAIWFLNYLFWWVFALLIGFPVDFVHFFAAMNIATVVGLLPITVGGFGTRELSAVYLLVLYGYSQNIAFLYTILSTTLGILIPALIGALFNITSKDLRY
jgi:uncharacterized protein (TIRG00374 family)